MFSLNEYFISPKVFLYPFGINIGSYPKPFSPFGGNCNVPKTFPSNDFIVPSGNAMVNAQQKKALNNYCLFLYFSNNFFSIFFAAKSKFFPLPAHLAE